MHYLYRSFGRWPVLRSVVVFLIALFQIMQAIPRCRICKCWTAKWDKHDLCTSCRSCSQESRCAVCREWVDEWTWLAQWRIKKQAKKKSNGSKDSSKEAKDKNKDNTKSKDSSSKSSSKDNSKAKNKDTSAKNRARSKEGANSTSVNTDDTGRPSSQSMPLIDRPSSQPRPASQPITTVALDQAPSVTGTTEPLTTVTSVATEPFVFATPAVCQAGLPGPSTSGGQTQNISIGSQPGTSGLSATHMESAGVISELLLASDSGSMGVRDFEGFTDPSVQVRKSRSRSRSRSKRSHRSRHRHRHHSSSSLSSSSPSPKRKRSHKPANQDSSQALSQILSLLTDLTRGMATPTGSQDTASAEPSSPGPSGVSNRDTQAFSDPEDEPDLIDDDPAVLLSGVDPPASETEIRDNGDSSSEEEPLFGTEIPQEVFDKAVIILRQQLGFETSSSVDPPSKSKLSLNRPTHTTKAALPVDAECEDRFKASAGSALSNRWTAFSKAQCSSFRVDEREWQDLFKTPGIPQAARDYLRSVGSLDASGKLKHPSDKRSMRTLSQLDSAARAGLKFSSALLLIAEVLMKSFRQSGSQEVSRKDTATLVSLVGPIARRVYDQFAKVSVRSVVDRRDIVLDAMRIPQRDVKRRFQQLPIAGEDLFGGQFDAQLITEVKRRKDMANANLSSARVFSHQRQFRPQPQSQRRRQPQSSSGYSRRLPPQSSISSRQRRPQRSFSRPAGRGSFRGSRTGRGRGFSRP